MVARRASDILRTREDWVPEEQAPELHVGDLGDDGPMFTLGGDRQTDCGDEASKKKLPLHG